MKRIVLYLFLIATITCSAADVERLTVEYQLLSLDRADAESPFEQFMMLSIGENMSKFYWVPSLSVRQRNIRVFRGIDTYTVYKNYPSKDKLTFWGEICKIPYVYEEPLPEFDWNIEDGDTVVCGYNCQKAQTTFRGRTWIVWFTLDLPYSEGPWKLCGLPGLILKAYDTEECFSFTAIEVKKGESAEISVDIKKCKKSSPQAFEKEMKALAKDPTQYNLDIGKGWTDPNALITNGVPKKFHIDPWVPNLIEYFEDGK